MTDHSLQGRSEKELLWFQRRGFLQAATAWTAAVHAGAVMGQTASNIVELMGDATVNGARLRPDQSVQTGDQIATGPKSTLIFTIGNSAFHVRQNSQMTVERGPSLSIVSILRLINGAVVSVWGRGQNRQIITRTLTAGIRGTGVYTEIFPQRGGRTYFCNCYGVVDLASGSSQDVSESEYHQAFWGDGDAAGGTLSPASAINHTDEELEYLAKLVGQRTAWQITGRKGNKSYERDYAG